MGVLIHSWMDSGVRFLIKGAYDFVDVRDVAHGIVLAGERGKAGQVYILSGEKIHMERMQVLVRQAAGLQPQVILIPTWLALFAANFTPWYYRMTGSKPRFTRYSVVTVTGNSDISSQRARSELGYQPRSLHESLQDTVQWWHAYLQNKTGEPAAIL
jgi:dihydroflavonol-4-reductase